MSSGSTCTAVNHKINVLFLDYGIGFGGAVISMAELVNSLPASVNPIILSAQLPTIVRPLLRHCKYVFFRMPTNYVLRDRMVTGLKKMKSPKFTLMLALKAYALLDWIAGYCYTLFIIALIKKYKIDLLHINNAPDLNGTRAAKWSKIPCITHCRGFVTLDRSILRYKPFMTTVKKFIAISQAVGDKLHESGIPRDRIEVIHNPVDLKKYDSARERRNFVRAQYSFRPEHVVVAIFGRITEWKGQLEFLESIELIAERCPQLRVMIVGDSSDDVQGYAKKVHEVSERGELRGRVVFTGYQQTVVDYYWASDIVVHNSIEPEPFGRVIVEAMACSRPIIAMKEGGPLDIIEHNHDGILVPPRNKLNLAEAIEHLYVSNEERHRLAANSRRSIELKFSGEVIAEQVVRVYEKVLCIAPLPIGGNAK